MTHYVFSGAILLVVVYKLLVNRGRKLTPVLKYLLLFFTSLAVGIVFVAPPTTELIMRFEPFPLTARLLGNAFQLLAMHFLVRLAGSTRTPEPRSGFRYLVVAWLTMTALLATTRFDAGDDGFTRTNALRPSLIGYQLVLYLYGAGCLVVFARMINRYAAECPPGPFRVGLRTVAASAVWTIFWATWACLPTVWILLTGLSRQTFMAVNLNLSWLTVALWIVGAMLATWGEQLARLHRRISAIRRYRAMAPLWSALFAAQPGIALTGLPRDPEFALYRRIIEIRDGVLVLRRHIPPQVAEWVRAPQSPATLEAASLAAALIAKEAGHSWPAAPHAPAAVDASIESETAWLTEVARAFATSPVVDEVRMHTTTRYGSHPTAA
ncbi:MAB_1171c family putative transporter [Amycolatopsis sp. cg5]|uniref:MAB_1171c family putative transporter n=1 Tax=Amycolatopsis sp. cg5 TaxID=3238802 RepID=UPI003526521B